MGTNDAGSGAVDWRAGGKTNYSYAILDVAEDALVGGNSDATTPGTKPYYYGAGGSTAGNKKSWGLLAWSMYIVGLLGDGTRGDAASDAGGMLHPWTLADAAYPTYEGPGTFA